jgi:hypothetical protein
MDVHIHANCQAIPIAGMLREADPDWRVTWFEVHGPEIIEHFDEHCARIRTADLVISQPIHQGYRDREELSIDWIRDHIRPDATLLVVPSMHFSGHHPGLDGLPLTGLPFLSNLLAAHLVASGCASDDAVRLLLSDNLLSDAEIDTEIQTSLDETTRRETEDHIDIRIGPFLAKHCRTRTLFHIQNHPLRETAAFVANQILARLGQPARVPIEGRDYQHATHVPPLPSVARYLRVHGEEDVDIETDEVVQLPGFPPMTQIEYYKLITERLTTFSPEEVFDAVRHRWPTVQLLTRLARQGSSIPGIARWAKG